MSLCSKCKHDIEGKFKTLIEDFARQVKASGASATIRVYSGDEYGVGGDRFSLNGEGPDISVSLTDVGDIGLDLEAEGWRRSSICN